MSLAKFITNDKDFSLLQTSWAASLDPLLLNPLVNGIFLKKIALINGVNVINHKLSRMMQGWFITDLNGVASIYRSAPLNNLTLTLTSSAAVMVDIYAF